MGCDFVACLLEPSSVSQWSSLQVDVDGFQGSGGSTRVIRLGVDSLDDHSTFHIPNSTIQNSRDGDSD